MIIVATLMIKTAAFPLRVKHEMSDAVTMSRSVKQHRHVGQVTLETSFSVYYDLCSYPQVQLRL